MPAILTACVVATVLVVHWPVLSSQAIVFDDATYLFDNPLLQHPSLTSAGHVFAEVLQSSTVDGYYEPLTLISLMVDVHLGGRKGDLRPFHRTSLCLHALNTALVVLLLYSLFGRPWVAAGVGLLFGIHPLTVEPVAWVWERKTVLAAFFSLACLLLYLRYARRPTWACYAEVLCLFVLALMAKPTATPMPILLLLLDYWPLRRLSWRAVGEKAPLFAVAALSATITIISTGRTGHVSLPTGPGLLEAPLTVCYLLLFYLGKIAWPVQLSPVYVLPDPMAISQPVVLACVVGMGALVGLLVLSLRWTRALATGWLFFAIAISPMLGVIGYSWVRASDKYVYLPSVGLLLVAAWLLGNLWTAASRPTAPSAARVGVIALVLIAAFAEAAATRVCLARWKETEAFYEYMLSLAPNVSRLYNGLGTVLADRGDFEKAVGLYEQAIAIEANVPDAHYNLGNSLYRLGKLDAAAVEYAKAIQLRPDHASAQNNLGAVLFTRGEVDAAIEKYRESLRLRPLFVPAHYNLAQALAAKGKLEEAVEHYREALRLAPGHIDARVNLARALVRQNRLDDATREYEEVLRMAPERSNARSELDALQAAKHQPP